MIMTVDGWRIRIPGDLWHHLKREEIFFKKAIRNYIETTCRSICKTLRIFRCPFRLSDIYSIKKMRIFYQKKLKNWKIADQPLFRRKRSFLDRFFVQFLKKTQKIWKWHQETAGEVSGVGGKYRCRHFTVDVHHILRINFVVDGFNSIQMSPSMNTDHGST